MNNIPTNYLLPQAINFGEQLDGSVIRPHGGVITLEQRIATMDSYESLPVYRMEKEATNFLWVNAMSIIQADTGSGKSTQLVKFLRKMYPESNIIVCQPRVVAAMNVADRIGYENIATSGNYKDDISSQYNPSGSVGFRTGK